MNFRIKIAALAATVLTVFLGGYFVKGKIEEAEQADLLRQQIRAQIERQDALTAIARRTEDELTRARAANANLNRRWNTLRAEKPDPCLLDADRIGLLRDATAPLGEAAR